MGISDTSDNGWELAERVEGKDKNLSELIALGKVIRCKDCDSLDAGEPNPEWCADYIAGNVCFRKVRSLNGS